LLSGVAVRQIQKQPSIKFVNLAVSQSINVSASSKIIKLFGSGTKLRPV